MKSFQEFMTENGRGLKSLAGDGGSQNQTGRWGQEPVHLGVHRIEDPNVLQRLNAHVGLINTREYIDPRSALEHVQNALMRLGYHFEYNMNEIPNEQNIYPLRRFGGRKGFIDMDAEIKEDDGIEGSGEKLVLNVEFFMDPDTSRYEVLAQIVPASLFDEEELQPEPIQPNRAGIPSTTGDQDGINLGEERRITNPGKLAALRGQAIAKGVAFRKRSEKTLADNKRRRKESAQRNKSVTEVARPRQRTKVEKAGSRFQVFVWSVKQKQFLPQGQPWPTKAKADADAAKFAANEETIREAVSISAGKEKGQGLFEVEFDFRGGPVRKQAQKFALAAQKRLEGARFTPNRKGTSEKVVVTVKASNPRDAQVKARNVLDGVKESLGEQLVTESLLSRTFAFSTPDARNRIEKLLDLASSERVTTSDKGKGKFKFTVTGILQGAQIDRIMNSVKQLKGKLAEEQVNEAAELSRTFAFSDASARDKIEKLLGLASSQPVSKSDKGKGKFKFTVTAMLKGAQIDRVFNSVKQLKGKLAENTTADMANNAVRNAIRERAERLQFGDLFLGKQLKIARGKLKMNPVFQKVMGGPSKEEAIKILLAKGSSADKKLAKRAMNEGVSISSGREPSTNWKVDVTFTDEGQRAKQFHKEAEKLGWESNFIPNFGKRNVDKVVVGVPARNGRDAQLKAQKLLPRLREQITIEVSEASAFVTAGLKNARETVKSGKQFVSVTGKMSEKKASQTVRGAAKFLRQHGTPADKKLAAKVLGEASSPGARAALKSLTKGAEQIKKRNEQNALKRLKALKTSDERDFGRAIFAAAKKSKSGAVSKNKLPDAKRFNLDPKRTKKIVSDMILSGVVNVTTRSSDPGRVAEQQNEGKFSVTPSEKAANQTRARILASRDKADKAQSARRAGEANPKITLTRLAKRLKAKQQSEEMHEGVQILPAVVKRFMQDEVPKTSFQINAVFSVDDWKGPLASAVRKELKKAGWKSFDDRAKKTIRVFVPQSKRAKDDKQATGLIGDLVAKARASVGLSERIKGPDARLDRALAKEKRARFRGRRSSDPSVLSSERSSLGDAGQRESPKERTATAKRLRARLARRRDTSEDCDGLSHDDNAKEVRRTRKDNKLASALKERLSKRKKNTTSAY